MHRFKFPIEHRRIALRYRRMHAKLFTMLYAKFFFFQFQLVVETLIVRLQNDVYYLRVLLILPLYLS